MGVRRAIEERKTILTKMRGTKEYVLAERIVFLEEALSTANDVLKENRLLGVLPSMGVSFRKASKHHKKVREILNNI